MEWQYVIVYPADPEIVPENTNDAFIYIVSMKKDNLNHCKG